MALNVSTKTVVTGASITLPCGEVVEFVNARKGGGRVKFDCRKIMTKADMQTLAEGIAEFAATLPDETPAAEVEPTAL
jgi:hypothetical protein